MLELWLVLLVAGAFGGVLMFICDQRRYRRPPAARDCGRADCEACTRWRKVWGQK